MIKRALQYSFLLSLSWLTAWASSSQADQSSAQYRGLAGALQATLTLHPAIYGKKAEIKAQQATLNGAEAARYPTLSGQAQTLDDGSNSGNLRVRQPLWAFGRIDADITQEQIKIEREQTALLEVQRDLIEQTAMTYQRVQSLTQRIALADADVQEHQRLFNRIQQRQRGSLASKADVSLAQSRLIRSQSQHLRLQGELDDALNELLRLTQVEVDSQLKVSSSYLGMPAASQLRQLALQHSARVQVKKVQAKVAKQAIETTRLQDSPTVFLQLDQELLDTPASGDRTRVGVVIEARTEGLGLAIRGRADSAKARYQAAQFDLDQSRNEVRRQLDKLLLNRDLQQRMIDSQQQVVEAVASTMASFLRQYDSGRKSWVEVLNTQRELTEQRQTLAQFENEWRLVTLRIAVLIGQLDSLAGVES